MALSYANEKFIYRGHYTIKYSEVTFDSSYASGGETVSASDFGFSQILAVIPTASAGYNVQYTKTDDGSGTLKVFASSNPSTNSATAVPLDSSIGRNYSSVSASLIVIGR